MCRRLIHLVSLALVLVLAAGVANADITSGLVGYYPLDEGAGDSAYDMSGNGHNGTLHNGVTWISEGFINGGVNLDGTTDTRIELGTWNPAEGTGQLSLALWIRWAGGGFTYQGLIGKRDTWPATTMFQFQVRPENDGTFRLETGTYAVVSPNATLAPFVQTWAHVAATFDGTTCRLYLNGEEIMSGAFAFNTAGETANMGIGCVTGGGEGYSGNTEVFLGDIDEVRIYNRALSEADIKSLGARYSASNPSPADGAVITETEVVLTWTGGTYANSHHVYFGTSFDEVYNGTGPADKGPAPWTAYWAPDLEVGKTYYWRIDEVSPTHPDSPWPGPVWSFTIPPQTAWTPDPADGAKFIDPNVTLSWSAGMDAFLHHVYFGDDFDDVSNADTSDTTGIYQGARGDLTFYPGPLALEKVHYWRIDEQEPSGSLHPGDVWSFTTVGLYAGVRAEYYHWTSAAIPPPRSTTFSTRVLTRIESEINHHWGGGSPDPLVNVDQFAGRWTAELEVAFSEPYTFWTLTDDGVRVWLDGELIIDNWTDHGDTWNSSQPIDLVAGQRYALVMEWFDNGGGATAELDWASPSVPRQVIPAGPLQLPLRASSPDPSNGATGVKETPTLKWKAGEQAVQHDVFFGTDRDAVANADTTTPVIYRGRQDGTIYVPSEAPLEWEQTYYWKINEVNGVYLWQGSVWSFTVADYLIVDDFEPYDDFCNRIFYTYGDGWGHNGDVSCGVPPYGGNGTGSTVGYLAEPYAEQTIVHAGAQSMPLEYLNDGSTGKALYSETERTFALPQDWTKHNVKALTLYFYGDPDNYSGVGGQMYVGLGDNLGHTGSVSYDGDPADMKEEWWHEWNIDLKEFSDAGVNLQSVRKMYIGVGDRNAPKLGGAGMLYVDDIRLYQSRCLPSLAKPAGDFNNNCVVDYPDLDVMTDNWLISDYDVTPLDPGTGNLVAYYGLENNTNDGSGNGHHGDPCGAPTYVTGPAGYGTAMHFDGTGVGNYVDLGTFDPSAATGELTVAVWANWDGLTSYWQGLVAKRDSWTATDVMWQLEADINTGTLGFFRYGGPNFGNGALPVGQWTHVAASFDGTTVSFYVNAELTGSGPFSFGPDTEARVVFGAVEGNGGNPFNGALDEIRIYGRGLTQGQVAWLVGKTATYTQPLYLLLTPQDGTIDMNSDGMIDLKDYAVLVDIWLDEVLWP